MENLEEISKVGEDMTNDKQETEPLLNFEQFREFVKTEEELARDFPGYGEAVSRSVETAIRKGVKPEEIKAQIDIEYNKDGLDDGFE